MPGGPSPALDHGQRFLPAQRLVCQRAVAVECPKEPALPVRPDAGALQIRPEVVLGIVVARSRRSAWNSCGRWCCRAIAVRSVEAAAEAAEVPTGSTAWARRRVTRAAAKEAQISPSAIGAF